jgi:iron complex transport system substrate-binding protein
VAIIHIRAGVGARQAVDKMLTTAPFMAERIVSFLPSATEIAFALGLGDRIVGVSHECDYPAEARTRPTIVNCAVPLDGLTPAEVDVVVSAQLRAGRSTYEVDTVLLRTLDPDLILAQDLCEVCAPSGNDTLRALEALDRRPEVLSLTPRSLGDIEEDVRRVARAAGCLEVAEELITRAWQRLNRIIERVRGAPRRRVFFVEWIDPIFCGGHWVPEMIELAGGVDALARKGGESVRVPLADVIAREPEVLIVSPCGAHLESAVEQAWTLLADRRWQEVPAVRSGEVYAVDASSYFARPGPRVFEGIEVLAGIIHPACFESTMRGAQRIGVESTAGTTVANGDDIALA